MPSPTRVAFVHNLASFPKLPRKTIDGVRYYISPDGTPYPSVTTVLAAHGREGIEEWKKRVGEKEAARVSKRATDRGTAVHSCIEKYLLNEEVNHADMMPTTKTLFVQLKPELNMINNVVCLETAMYSKVLQLAGTVDCIAEFDGKLSVIDFKTSSRLKKKVDIESYFMQCCAYAIMYEELTGVRIDQGVILIGVDNVSFPQVFKFNPHDYRAGLEEYIALYRREQLFG